MRESGRQTRESVLTLPSGLQDRVITADTDPKLPLDQTAVCQYRGTLIDGREFDNSCKRKAPASFPVKGVP